jgi:protein-L-isoaspartate O-methyltransferase
LAPGFSIEAVAYTHAATIQGLLDMDAPPVPSQEAHTAASMDNWTFPRIAAKSGNKRLHRVLAIGTGQGYYPDMVAYILG